MQAAIGKELPFLRRLAQVLTGGQLQRIGAEGFLHARQVVGFVLRMNPFVQKEIGDVTQQQRTRIVRRLEAGQDVVGRMVPVVLEAFGQRTDVDQIVGLQDDERGCQHSLLVHHHIQQVELRMAPQQFTRLPELFVHVGHVVAHLEPFVCQGVEGLYIEVGVVSVLKAHAHALHAASHGHHHVGGVGAWQEAVEGVGDILVRQKLDEESQRLHVAQQIVAHRLFFAIEHTIGRQAKSVQAVLLYNRKADFRRHVADAGGKVGHLQTAVRHLCAA